MSELIVTCAGCGKRYKGTPGPKKYRCGTCSNLFTFPEQAHIPDEGKVFCSFCWGDFDYDDQLEGCPTCNQKISPLHGGRAISADAPDDLFNHGGGQELHDRLAVANRDMEAKIAELQTRLEIAQEGQQVAFKERDAAVEGRHKLEKTLGEFLSRFASAQEGKAAIVKDRDAEIEARKKFEARVAELEAELTSTQEAHSAALNKWDESAERVEELEVQITAIRSELNRSGKSAPAENPPAHETRVEAAPFGDSGDRIAQLLGDLDAAREAHAVAVEERDGEAESRRRLEAHVQELEDRLASFEAAEGSSTLPPPPISESDAADNGLMRRLEEQNSELKSAYTDLENAHTAALDDLQEIAAERRHLEHQLTALQQQQGATEASANSQSGAAQREAFEAQIAELQRGFHLAKEAQQATAIERDNEAAARRALKDEVEALRQSSAGSLEAHAAIAQARDVAQSLNAEVDSLMATRSELEAQVDELQRLLLAAEAAQADAESKLTTQTDAHKKAEARIAEIHKAIASSEEAHAAVMTRLEAEVAERRTMEGKVAETKRELDAVLVAKTAIEKARDEAATARDEATKSHDEIAKSRDEIAKSRDEIAKARGDAEKARDEAHALAAQEQDRALEAQSQLSQFQEMAVNFLEPLGMDFSQSMKTLMTETEAIAEEARRARDEAQKSLDKLERASGDLKVKLGHARKDFVDRLSHVLGTSPAVSGVFAPVATASDNGPELRQSV